MRAIGSVLLVILFSGCSSFIIRDDDDPLTTSGKFMTRLIFGVATVGVTEIGIDAAKQQEEIAARRAACGTQGMVFAHYVQPYQAVGCMTQASWEQWVRSEQTNKGMNPLAGLLMLQAIQSTPRYQYQPLPVPKLNQFGTTCFNTLAGNQVITQCY